MIRLFFFIATSCVTASLFLPMIAYAQSSPSSNPQNEAVRKFRAYLDADWKKWMEEYPEKATQYGYPGQNARWMDDSPKGIERRRTHLHDSLATLKQISRDALPADEQLNYDLYRQILEDEAEGLQYGDDPRPFRDVVPRSVWMPINQMEGIQQLAPEILENTPHQTV